MYFMEHLQNIDKYRYNITCKKDKKYVYTHYINNTIDVEDIVKSLQNKNMIWIILHGDLVKHVDSLTSNANLYVYNVFTNELELVLKNECYGKFTKAIDNRFTKYLPNNYYTFHKQYDGTPSGFMLDLNDS